MNFGKLATPVVSVIAMLLSATACDGFYADVPTITPGPEPTAATAGDLQPAGTAAEIAEAAARAALGQRLGIDPARPSFAGLRGATWTRSSPGCFPPPEGYDGEYLIPGLRLSLVYARIRYEYDADLPATTGALCDTTPQTPQDVGVTLAEDTVITHDASRLADRVIALADADAARAYMQVEAGIAEIDTEDVDWAAEVLVGTALPEVEPALEVVDVSAVWDMTSNLVTIDVETNPAGAPPEGAGPATMGVAVWVLIEYPPAGASFEFRVHQSEPATGSP